LANLAFEEAVAHYERALAVLEPRGADGERLRCDLLLALGDAPRRAVVPERQWPRRPRLRTLGDGGGGARIE
jgi:hypothetical protein